MLWIIMISLFASIPFRILEFAHGCKLMVRGNKRRSLQRTSAGGNNRRKDVGGTKLTGTEDIEHVTPKGLRAERDLQQVGEINFKERVTRQQPAEAEAAAAATSSRSGAVARPLFRKARFS